MKSNCIVYRILQEKYVEVELTCWKNYLNQFTRKSYIKFFKMFLKVHLSGGEFSI